MRCPTVIFPLPVMSADEKEHLHVLARSMRGIYIPRPSAYRFTVERHRKFMWLHRAGFRCAKHKGIYFYMHPDHSRSFKRHEAVLVAKIMAGAAQVAEEAP